MANLAIGLASTNFGIQEYEIRCFDPTPGSAWAKSQAPLQVSSHAIHSCL